MLWLSGDHDIATKVSVAVGIARAAQCNDLPLLIDLSAVTFMDASTIGAIVGSRNRLRSRGQSLEVRAPSPQALHVLELCELTHLIQRELVSATGTADALATWIDVRPITPTGEIGLEDARIAAPATTRQPARVSAAVDARLGSRW